MLSLALHLSRCSPLHAESWVFANGLKLSFESGNRYFTNGHCFLEDELAETNCFEIFESNISLLSTKRMKFEEFPELSTQDMDIVMLLQHSLSARRLFLMLCCLFCKIWVSYQNSMRNPVSAIIFPSQTFAETLILRG